MIYDDRDASPGEKFADAELLGCPLRLTVGRKRLENGEVEAQVRRGQEKRSLPLDGAAQAAVELWRELPEPRQDVDRSQDLDQGLRMLSGIDRSDGPPPETRKGQPLRPLDDPQLRSPTCGWR